jgi:hypothetical protein
MRGFDRHDEADAVGGGEHAAAPGPREGDCILRGHQQRVGGTQGVIAHEILVYPGQAVCAQRRRGVRARERFDADIASLAEQHRAQAQFQVTRARGPLTDVGERRGEAGTGGDLYDGLRVGR